MRYAIALLLSLSAVAAAAAGETPAIQYNITRTGTYTPAGMTTPVDVYTLTFYTDPNLLLPPSPKYPNSDPNLIGALWVDIGADNLGYGGNPFQVGIKLGGTQKTPTPETVADWLSEETFARQADSHFLFPGDWAPAVVVPTETNDGSLGTFIDPSGLTEVRGLGGLRAIVGVPVADRASSIDIASVGVPQGTVVYFYGQPADAPGDTRDFEAIQFPMAYRSNWQGSGTGGNTSTDPNNPVVQWSQAANWSGGTLPTLLDDVRIETTGPGIAVADSSEVGSLWVNSPSGQGSLHIPAAADVEVAGSIIVGTRGTGSASQSGNSSCTFFTLGEELGSSGAYELSDGSLTVSQTAYIGKSGSGLFTQTGGIVQIGKRLRLGYFAGASGTYDLAGGFLAAPSVHVLNDSSLFRQSGGSLTTDRLYVSNVGRFSQEGGVILAGTEELLGTFVQTGGVNHVSGTLKMYRFITVPAYELRGGVLSASHISGSKWIHVMGGNLSAGTISGQVTVSSGAFSVKVMDDLLTNDGGVVAPGNSIGAMKVKAYQQNSGKLEIELGSLTEFDRLIAAETVALAGELEVALLDGYVPQAGDEFPILTAGESITGAFQTITEGFDTRIDGGTLYLTAIPEPTAALLLGLGAAAWAIRRRTPKR